MRLPLVLSTTLLFAMSSAAQSALLKGIHGGVRVNQGKGYIAVHDAAELKPGDMVMVDAKSGARLLYPDGCDVGVKARSVMIVGDKSPCSQMTAQFGPPGTVPPNGEPWASDVAMWAVGGGVLAAGGLIACAAACPDRGSSTAIVPVAVPTSP